MLVGRQRRTDSVFEGRYLERISAVRRRMNIEVRSPNSSLAASPFSFSFSVASGCLLFVIGTSNCLVNDLKVPRRPGLIRSTIMKNSLKSF